MSQRSLLAAPPATAMRRRVSWCVAGVVILVLVVAGLALGELPLTLSDVWAALTGTADQGVSVVVLEWRLPRIMLGALLGAALGLSGALFQTVTRNPLGSPDVLGFSTGAFTGALIVMLGGIGGYFATAVGALIGGLATAAIVWVIVIRRGAQGFRLIVVGIGITAMINAVNVLMITSAQERDALSAAIWAAGSLNGVESLWIVPTLIVLAVCAAATAAIAPSLGPYELGDDTSGSLGVNVSRVQLLAMIIGVVLVAAATAVAGPIAFVALAAPQIARQIWSSSAIPLVASAVMGAVLLMTSDLIAQRLLAPTILPTGIVTICLGGVYLIWALARKGHNR
jgi:iron complex transport system permease protein